MTLNTKKPQRLSVVVHTVRLPVVGAIKKAEVIEIAIDKAEAGNVPKAINVSKVGG